MGLVTADIARQRLESAGAEIHYLQAARDRKTILFRATYTPHENVLRSIPALFVTLCIEGGGRVWQKAGLQEIDCEVAPGDIAIVPPKSNGFGRYPEITVISMAIAVECLAESFGKDWPQKLKKSVVSQLFRDPLVEATMMDIGYTRAGLVSDSTLLHAAHMIIHQLLDRPFAGHAIEDEVVSSDAHPISKPVLHRIEQMLEQNLDQHVTVEAMADIANISRHHFSRRFKAATGQSPHQFALQRKLDHAASLLIEEEESSIISVAQRVGYGNPAQFARIFRKNFGLTPRSWRKSRSK
ncbi:MAG: AraC family transcriptional regulator [Pseudomonadota bacterium]